MPSRTSREQRNAQLILRRIADAIIATVNENPHGAPAGPMYAAVMQYMTLAQFESLMRSLVEAKRVRRQGDLYFPAEGR
jgi:hypothetical protein